MKGFNRRLAIFAAGVLLVTLTLMGTMRQRLVRDMEQSIQNAQGLFRAEDILHGPGGERLVRFGDVESRVAVAKDFAYIRDAVVTKRMETGQELPIVPYDFRIRYGAGWRDRLSGWRRVELGDPAFGFLYLLIDRSVLRAMNLAIGAVGLALALMLVALLARVWRQETSLTRTMIELNERRRELIRLERLALAGQLTASLLHDLRKPVMHIQHSLDDLDETAAEQAPSAMILQDLRRQTRLFFQMLSDSQIERFVRSERASEEYVNIPLLIEFALNLVRYEKGGVELALEEGENLPPVLAHPFRLVQVFSNLVLNAYQALDGRGRLTIQSEAEAGGVTVRFIDDGPGMAIEELDRIFDPFYTTKPEGEGTGLGLSICRMIVEECQGRIAVESRPGGPTVFSVWLPAEGAGSIGTI